MIRKKAIIISIKGTSLSYKEKLLLSKEKPWGLILFKRNISSKIQTNNLIKDIKKNAGERNFPILIDEEGAKVSRLKEIFKLNIDANYFGNLYKINSKIAIVLYKNYLKSLCTKLKKLVININTIPLLYVLRKNTNNIIVNRSYSHNKEIVKKLD